MDQRFKHYYFVQKCCVLAAHPDCKTYDEAILKEIGPGCCLEGYSPYEPMEYRIISGPTKSKGLTIKTYYDNFGEDITDLSKYTILGQECNLPRILNALEFFVKCRACKGVGGVLGANLGYSECNECGGGCHNISNPGILYTKFEIAEDTPYQDIFDNVISSWDMLTGDNDLYKGFEKTFILQSNDTQELIYEILKRSNNITFDK